jgi:hypothetical protein
LMFTLAAASETWWDPLIHWPWTFVLWHVIQVRTESLLHTLQVGKLSDALKARHEKMLTVYWAEHEILWYMKDTWKYHENHENHGDISSKILPTYFTKKHPKHVQNSSALTWGGSEHASWGFLELLGHVSLPCLMGSWRGRLTVFQLIILVII